MRVIVFAVIFLWASTCLAQSNGTVTNNGDGTLTYTPDPHWYGVDSFSYEICDPDGLCSCAGVTVTVNPVNDAPVAQPDSAVVPKSGQTAIDVLANDSDIENDPLNIVSVTQGAKGSVGFGGGFVTYTPGRKARGSDAFSYTVSDGALEAVASVSVSFEKGKGKGKP